MRYIISSFDPIDDELIEYFIIPNELNNRILEIIGSDYDGKSDYTLSKLTLELLKRTLVKYSFKYNPELLYSIGIQ